jgi:hypothetical protein
MTRDELNRLRREALQAQRRVNNKVSRLKAKGVHIAGSKHDPRTDAKKIGVYTAKQLISYINKAESFTSRKTSFVGGVEGKPIPKELFLKYKRLEAIRNNVVDARMSERGHYMVPGLGKTIQEREDSLFKGKRAQGGPVSKEFVKFNRSPENINGVEGLTKLIRDYQKKNKRATTPKMIKEWREQLDEMLKTIGNDNYRERANALSDYQFDIMFDNSEFAGNASLLYEMAKSMASGRKQAWFDGVSPGAHNAITDALEWAEKELPTEKGGLSQSEIELGRGLRNNNRRK